MNLELFGEHVEQLRKEPRIQELVEREQKVTRARESVIAEIMESEAFSEDSARNFGGLYAAYSLEKSIHAVAIFEAEIDLSNNEDFKSIRRQDLEAVKQWMPTLKEGFLDAQEGDYRSLKNWLLQESVAVREVSLERKLREIARSIPDQASHFVPPIPAWQDPRFAEGPA